MVTIVEKPKTKKEINIEAINKTIVLTPRVQRLKQIRTDVRTPIVSAERARLYRESWEQTKGEHGAIRRAKAFRHFLENKELVINDDELIVGMFTKYPRGVYANPQEFPQQVANVIRKGIKAYSDSVKDSIPKDDLDTILECCEYWASEYPGARIEQKVKDIAGDQYAKMIEARLLAKPPHARYLQLSGQDWDKLFAIGLNGMIAEVGEKVAALKENPPTTESIDKITWYESVIMSLEAVITLARRYAKLAREMAARERNTTRKAELEKIAEICEWVPANPPRSFYEALQFHWFVVLCLELERNNSYQASAGRFDQYMWPYYEGDIREGRMTYDEAGELLACLLAKGMTMDFLAADFTE
ncbi:pyruvate formate lyase family protein, partial [Chloroflexota bacterium]